MDPNDFVGFLSENGSRSLGSISNCSESKLQKSSILKPSKARPPLQDLNFYCDVNNEEEETTEVVRRRKVSFHHVNNIKEFCPSSETLKICTTSTYEETLSSESSNFSRNSSKASLIAMSLEALNVRSSESYQVSNDDMDISDSSLAMNITRCAPSSDGFCVGQRTLSAEKASDVAVGAMGDTPFLDNDGVSDLLEGSSLKEYNCNLESLLDLDVSLTNGIPGGVVQQRSVAGNNASPAALKRKSVGMDLTLGASACYESCKVREVDESSMAMELTGVLDSESLLMIKIDKGDSKSVEALSTEMQRENSFSGSILDMSITSAMKESDLKALASNVLNKSHVTSLFQACASPKEPATPIVQEKSISSDQQSILKMTDFGSSVPGVSKCNDTGSESDGGSTFEPAFFRDSVSAEKIERPVRGKTSDATPALSQNWFTSLETQETGSSPCHSDLGSTDVQSSEIKTPNSVKISGGSEKLERCFPLGTVERLFVIGSSPQSQEENILEGTLQSPAEDRLMDCTSRATPISCCNHLSSTSSHNTRYNVSNETETSKALSVSQAPVLQFGSFAEFNDENKLQSRDDLWKTSDTSVSMIRCDIGRREVSAVNEIEPVWMIDESVTTNVSCPKINLSSYGMNTTVNPSVTSLPPPELSQSPSSKDSSIVSPTLAEQFAVNNEKAKREAYAVIEAKEMKEPYDRLDEPMNGVESETSPENGFHMKEGNISRPLPYIQPKLPKFQSPAQGSCSSTVDSLREASELNKTTPVPLENLTPTNFVSLHAVTEPKPKLKYSDFGFKPTRRLTLNFTMDNSFSNHSNEESQTASETQTSFLGLQCIQQTYETRESNRLFMEKLGFERVDLDEWRWPIRSRMFYLVIKCPLSPLDDTTRPTSLYYEVGPEKQDQVASFLAEKIKQTFSERWLAVRCNTLKDLTVVLKTLKSHINHLKPLCSALNYISLRYPCRISGNMIQFTIVHMKSVVKYDVLIDLKNWENLSGADVSIANKIGNVNDNMVRLLFNETEKTHSMFYSFINALRKYRERLLI